MERMRIAAIFADQESLGGKDVTVCGWARTIRDMKTFGFIELNDGSCFKNLQVVMSAEELANYKEIAAQNVGAALIVRGTVVLTPEAKQPLEIKAHAIEVEGKSTPDYPLQKKRHSVEFLRTIQHLRPRTNLFSATFRVRSAAAYAVQQGAAPQPDRQQEQDGPGQKGQPSARPAPPQKQTLAQHAQLPRHGQGHQDQKQHHHRHVFPPEFTIL